MAATLGAAGVAGAAGPVLVRPDDLGPGKSWLRLQDDPSNASKSPGVQEIVAEPDPVWKDGSLHLGVSEGRQAQAAHYFPAKRDLAQLVGTGISYRAYQNSAKSTAGGYGANLQLPATCQGAFTTLSFEPGVNTDVDGRTGVAPDTWQELTFTASSQIRTSRAVAGVAAGASAPLSTFTAACDTPGDGVSGVIANVGRLGSDTATLDTYVDDIRIDGAVYNFTTAPAPSPSPTPTAGPSESSEPSPQPPTRTPVPTTEPTSEPDHHRQPKGPVAAGEGGGDGGGHAPVWTGVGVSLILASTLGAIVLRRRSSARHDR